MNNFDDFISVSALNGYIKSLMERDDFLCAVAVRGEISNFKRNISGHLYFSLKDEGGAVSAVMFRSAAARLNFNPKDGMKVTLYGRVSLYEKTGQYQIYVSSMNADGAGDLAQKYEMLKNKLESEGLFDPSRKRKIPRMPEKIGIVTSATGAAIRDMINVSGRRYPLADLVIFPSAVQGAEAAPNLCMGIECFNALSNVDVIIIGRGGGSIEDLWAFNDENLVRAVAASKIPVISAVGHETDFTLCDFAADLRAPTPSAAAEVAVPDVITIKNYLANREVTFLHGVQNAVAQKRDTLKRLQKTVELNSPTKRLENSKLGVMNLETKIQSLIERKFQISQNALGTLSAKLSGMNPLAVLSRGYSAVEDSEGKIVCSAKNLSEGQKIGIIMSDGKVFADVTKALETEKI